MQFINQFATLQWRKEIWNHAKFTYKANIDKLNPDKAIPAKPSEEEVCEAFRITDAEINRIGKELGDVFHSLAKSKTAEDHQFMEKSWWRVLDFNEEEVDELIKDKLDVRRVHIYA